jgi:TPR repeat protein
MPTLRRAVVALGLLLALATSATAGPLEDAQAADERGDYAIELTLLKPLAEQGNAAAQHNLGVIYDNGQGVPQDFAQAVKWFRKAADQGNAAAQNNLGSMYADGKGVPQDYVQALAWWHKAADQGDTAAQDNLGLMYANGRGVPQDYVQAHMWFNLAAAQGDKDAATDRDALAKLITPEQLAEAQKLASTFPAVAASGTDLTLFGKDPGQDRAFACYTRAYDPAHLKAHRQQNVTQMMVLIDSAYDSESQARTYGLMMGVHFRKLNSQFEAGGGCSSTIDGKALLNCGIECDGGRIDVRVKDANRILVDVPDGAFTWNADAPDDDPPEGAHFGPDDKTFLLSRAALTQCVDLASDDDKHFLTDTH